MGKSPRIILGVADSITVGAALVVNGRVEAAVNEERLCRTKMAIGWPGRAIAEVLRIAGCDATHVDAVSVATRHLYVRPDPPRPRALF